MSLLLLVRWRWRNKFQPATRTLFDVSIITLSIWTEIPIILFLRLGIYLLWSPLTEPGLPPEGLPDDLPPDGGLGELLPDGALNDLPPEGALNDLPPEGAPIDFPLEGGLILLRLKIDLDPFLTPEEIKFPFL
jgi:hypothetical protein